MNPPKLPKQLKTEEKKKQDPPPKVTKTIETRKRSIDVRVNQDSIVSNDNKNTNRSSQNLDVEEVK